MTDNKISAGLLEPAEYGEYLLRNPVEMHQVLRQLLEHGSLITIFFNEGADLILSNLLAIKDDGLIFDYGASAETNQRALQARKLFCITLLDKVRVQFILHGLTSTTHEDRPAFHAGLPDNVLRLQRREYYRLTMPLTRRLTCQIPLPDGQRIGIDVVDLSGGGLALVAPPVGVSFAPDTEFADCHIELPEVGGITTTIRVLSAFEVTLPNGAHVTRTGCRFVGLPGTTSNLIQRYIIKVERERKALENGLM